MTDSAVEEALRRLRSAADDVGQGLLPGSWRRVDGPGPDSLPTRASEFHFTPMFSFEGLTLSPGSTLTLDAGLEVPSQLHGVPLLDEPLLVTVNSLYPTQVEVDGRQVFSDNLPVVASGPALVEGVQRLRAGDVQLRVTLHAPNQQLRTDWCWLHLTTPSLRQRFFELDSAWARLRLADAYATTDDERKAVTAAAVALPDPLPLADVTALAAALQAFTDALAPAAARVERINVHAIGHSHIDLQWCWTWDDTREVIKRDVRSVLALLDEFPDMTFTHSQPAGYEVLREEAPELYAGVCDRVAEGRWEPATMQWVEGDVNLAGGEAQARQLLDGVRWTERSFGVAPRAFLAPDTFGHAGNLPQLATSAGASVYYHHRGNPGQRDDGPLWPAYWWEGDDGTRILAVSTPVYLGPVTPSRVATDVIDLGLRFGLDHVLYFYGVGDHGGGPTRQSLETIAAIDAAAGLPTMRCSTLEAFGHDVRASGVPLPTHRGESTTVFEGCYTTHADAKRLNRDGENELATAETLSVLAGLDRTDALSRAWRHVLFHQFHDILDGSAIKEAYVKTAEDIGSALATARAVVNESLDRLHAGIDADVVVSNPLGVDRRDVVSVATSALPPHAVAVGADGRHTPVQRTGNGAVFVADVHALSTDGFRFESGEPAESAITVGDSTSWTYPGAAYFTVDTPHLFAMVRKDCGVLTTLFDKRTGRELVGHNIARATNLEQVRPDLGAGVLIVFDEHPHVMSSWSIDEVHTEQWLIRGAAVELVEHGPVRAVFRVRQSARSSRLDRTITFYADLPRVDIGLDVEWNEMGGPEHGVPNLAMSFGFRLAQPEFWCETPFSAARRRGDGLPVPALRWADLADAAGGVAVLNDGKYGVDALGSRLRVHLLRTAYDPDLTSDVGYHDTTRLALLPHAGDWRSAAVPAAAAAFNQPLVAGSPRPAAPSSATPPSRPRLESGTAVMLSTLKHAHDGSGVVCRVYDSTGNGATDRLVDVAAGASVYELDLVERRRIRRLEVHGGAVDLRLRPHEVLTLLVD